MINSSDPDTNGARNAVLPGSGERLGGASGLVAYTAHHQPGPKTNSKKNRHLRRQTQLNPKP